MGWHKRPFVPARHYPRPRPRPADAAKLALTTTGGFVVLRSARVNVRPRSSRMPVVAKKAVSTCAVKYEHHNANQWFTRAT